MKTSQKKCVDIMRGAGMMGIFVQCTPVLWKVGEVLEKNQVLPLHYSNSHWYWKISKYLHPYTQHQQCTMSQLEVVSYLVSTLCCSKVITQARCGCGGLKLAWRRDGSVTLFLPSPGPAAVLHQRHNITDHGINHRNATSLRGHTATQLGPETRSRVELQTNLRED